MANELAAIERIRAEVQPGLPPAIVPSETSVTIAEGPISKEACLDQKSEVLAERVKVELSRGGDQRMLSKDDDAFSMFSREPLEPNTEIDLFTGEQFFAEAANFTKRRGFAKYE